MLSEAVQRNRASSSYEKLLMPEVTDTGEYHRDAALVRRGDHLLVAHAAAGLDDGNRTVVSDDVEAITERKERVRRDDRPRKGKPRALRLDRGNPCRIDAAHLAGAD